MRAFPPPGRQVETCIIRPPAPAALPGISSSRVFSWTNTRFDTESVVQDPDEKEAEEGEGGADRGAAETHAHTHKIRDDVELILAALVDFRRDMKALTKKVQQITDTDGNHKHMPTLTKHHPGFLE